jgi:hypothetical protein
MLGFEIKGDQNFIRFSIKDDFGFPNVSTHYSGGYELIILVKIKSGDFQASKTVYSSSGELYTFFNKLKECHSALRGGVNYKNHEGDLDVYLGYEINGRISVSGTLSSFSSGDNELKFSFSTDQSYINEPLIDLKQIIDKYGGMTGKLS